MEPVKSKIEAQNNIIQSFEQLANHEDERLYEIIISILEKRLNVSNGRIIFDDNSYVELGVIVKDIIEKYKAGDYTPEVSKLLRSFSDITQTTLDVNALFNDESKLSDINFSNEKQYIINELSDRLGSAKTFEYNIVSEIRQMISRSLVTQESLSDLKTLLKNTIIAKQGKPGIIGRYVNQITTDAVMQYTGIINTKIKEELDLDAIRYIGSIIDTSRPQCIRWISKGGVLLQKRSETNMYLQEEIKWAKVNGSGYGKPGKSYYIDLNSDNFLTYRGGYGCRHEAIAFRYTKQKEDYLKKLQMQHQKFLDKQKAA